MQYYISIRLDLVSQTTLCLEYSPKLLQTHYRPEECGQHSNTRSNRLLLHHSARKFQLVFYVSILFC